MKKISGFAVLAAAAGSFAFDQYLPVAKGKLETDVMFTHFVPTGGYDADGKSYSAEGSPASEVPSLQFKYGILDGFDVSLYAEYDINNKDYGDNSGLARPQLALKYVVPDLGVGGFVNVSIPVGSEDIVTDEPITSVFGGVIYGKTFGPAVVNAFAGYLFNTEDAGKAKQDFIDIYAQGQYNATDKIGPYLGVDFTKAFEAKVDGTSISESDGYLLTLKPGINYVVSDKIALEATVPVAVLGKSASSYWAVYAGFYYTIGL